MTDNDNLELKKRSRRRLVGAAALALLAAIVLPMVMDQEPEPPAQDIQITIPDREADSALARPIAGRPGSVPDTQVAPAPEEQPPGPQSEPPVPPVAEPVPPVPTAPATAQAPATPLPKPAEAPKPTDTPKPTEAPKPRATPPADEAARVTALLEGRTSVATAPTEAFVVQVGAFGDSAKAASISSQLKGKGFAAYTEKAGAVTRVRIGPFSSREEAGKVAERLRADGVQGVVTPR